MYKSYDTFLFTCYRNVMTIIIVITAFIVSIITYYYCFYCNVHAQKAKCLVVVVFCVCFNV